MGHADNLHIGASVLGNSLANLIVANNERRRVERIEAQAEANSVRSVRRLARMLTTAQNDLAASQAREAVMQLEIDRLRFDLGRAHATLRRLV